MRIPQLSIPCHFRRRKKNIVSFAWVYIMLASVAAPASFFCSQLIFHFFFSEADFLSKKGLGGRRGRRRRRRRRRMLLPLLRSSSYRPSLAKTKREKSRDEQKLLGTKGNRERERERERKACCLPLPKLHKSVDRILIRRQLTSDTYTCKP